MDKTDAEINLVENETGISPGQACVFYSKNELGDKVLGGGWIMKTINKYLSTWLALLRCNYFYQPNSDLEFILDMMYSLWLKRQLLTGQIRKNREVQAYRAENGGQ